jgi:tRNA1Val (adenine37-N6)-methyltransferase
VLHESANLKVTTEALILGGYVANDFNTCKTALDIGTGTGLLALMLAQKSEAKIDAVEIEELAFNLAFENIKKSVFSNKITVHHNSIQNFAKKNKFELIFSNPPFFQNHLKSSQSAKNTAIHNDSLSFTELSETVFKYLRKNGNFVVLLPAYQLSLLETKLLSFGIKKKAELRIHPTQNSKVLRIIATFAYKTKINSSIDFFIKNHENKYSNQFKDLLKDYYLIF